jgi:pSer/pThr/pTyr-binding forkhead associated (FHA) protein
MKYCPICSAANPDNQEFCLECSAELANLNSQPQSNVDSQSGRIVPGYIPGDLKLVVKQGRYPTMEYLLDEPNMVIGRRDAKSGFFPDIDLYDQEDEGEWSVSRNHARLAFREGGLFVIDLDSLNGTYVNGPLKIVPNEEVKLQPGDVIALGPKIILKLKEHTNQ